MLRCHQENMFIYFLFDIFICMDLDSNIFLKKDIDLKFDDKLVRYLIYYLFGEIVAFKFKVFP